MKPIRSMILAAVLAGVCSAQTGPGTLFFYGTHHATDQLLEKYPYATFVPGYDGWYIIRAPTPSSYTTFQNLLDVHSITITKNGRVLTARQQDGEPTADYGFFVLSSTTASAMVVIILAQPLAAGDVLRASFDYIQQ